METQELVVLNRIAAILSLAFNEEIEQARNKYREDAATAMILDLTIDWIGTTDLQAQVASATGVSSRTVRNRISELRDRGLLLSSGEASPMYKSAGVI